MDENKYPQEEIKSTTEEYSVNLIPPKGDSKVGETVFSIMQEVLNDKKNIGLHGKWERNYELARGKHWRNSTTTKVPLTTVNLIYRVRQKTINTLTDNNPSFNVARIAGNDTQFKPIYDKIHKATQKWWVDTNQQKKFVYSVTDGETYGCSIEHVRFNPELEFGLGEVETVNVDPFYFGLYPVKTDEVQNAEAVLYYYPVCVRALRRKYPEFASKIRADSDLIKELGDARRELASGPKADGRLRGYVTEIASTFKTILAGNKGDMASEGDETVVCECWVKDYTEQKEIVSTEQVMTLPDGQQVAEMVQQEVSKPMYPGNIRKIVVCNGGELVLEDTPNPNINPNIAPEKSRYSYLYDRFPFTRTVSIIDTSDPWGISDIEQLESINIELDKSISQFVLLKDKIARPKIVNPRDSGVENEDFTNVPSIINPANSNVAAGIRWLDFPNVPQDLTQSIELFKEMFALVSGMFDFDAPSSQSPDRLAYDTVALVIENVGRILRGKIRNYYYLICERGKMAVSLMQNWYTEERNFATDEDDGPVVARGEDLLIPTRISVVPGSTLPVSKVQQRHETIELFKLGAFGPPGSPTASKQLLNKLEYADYEEIMKELQAGPVGMILEKLTALGLPKELAQYFQQVATMDDKEFGRAMKDNKIPPFMQVLKKIMQQQGPPQPTPEEQMQQVELEAKKAEAESAKAQAQQSLAQAQ